MEKITNKVINAFADEAHRTAKGKGFWEERSIRHQRQALMLVVSELCEALENERQLQPKKADINAVEKKIEENKNEPEEVRTKMFLKSFIASVKDTTPDELADAAIRLFDFARGYKIEIDIDRHLVSAGIVSEENFAGMLFYASGAVHQFPFLAMESRDLNYLQERAINTSLKNVIHIAEKMNIDLEKHIKFKMMFNALRPYMNGKQF